MSKPATEVASLLEGLNPEQRLAVETTQGSLLILAGAGSGKTRVLTLRIAYLVNHCGVSPRSILGLTFTNKAAAEMRHRIATLVPLGIASQITLCTFHSFCMQVLSRDIHHLGYTSQFSLYDENDVLRLIKLIARDILEVEGELPSLAATLERINKYRQQGAAPTDDSSAAWHDQFSQQVYRRLNDSMRAYNAVDFDHLLTLTIELFEKHPEVLQHYQETYHYIMIDEYQDTNPIQYRLATLLSEKHHNLCVVGDDDQSIYGWRGADVRNILNFPAATVIKLEQNYRSTNHILKAANAVIGNNQARFPKVLWSACGDGPLIEIFHAPNDLNEAEAVAFRICKLKEQHGLKWKDIAILYRSNILSRQFEQALIKQSWHDGYEWVRGIPYQVFGGTEFYERKEIKDLAAYLRVIVNPLDQEALLRIINQPRRGIGDVALDALTAYNRRHHLPLWTVLKAAVDGKLTDLEVKASLSAKVLGSLRQFIATLETAKEGFERGEWREVMQKFIEAIDYQRAIREEVKSEQMRAFKWENVEAFVTSLDEFYQGHRENDASSLHQFLTTLPLGSSWEKGRSRNREEDRVNLLTFHSAKGLEFPACFLVGIEDHIIPHEKSLKETGLEEERRLMYVALTRAKRFLTLSMAKQRKRMGVDHPSRPSRFLFEIPKELLNVALWHEAAEKEVS